MTTRMTTDKKNESRICAFPRCTTGLNSYRQDERFCCVHSRLEYQQHLADDERREREIERLQKELAAPQTRTFVEENSRSMPAVEDRITGHIKGIWNSKAFTAETIDRLITVRSGVYFRPGFAQANPPYAIEEKGVDGFGKGRFLVRANVPPLVTPLEREPDLFIRFAELPEEEEAYISFVSKYGFLGFRNSWRPDRRYAWQEHEEPLLFIRLFHGGFKNVFDMAKDFVKGRIINDEGCLENFFVAAFQDHVTPIIDGLKGGLVLSPKNLAGTLTLQLYRFVVVGKMLKECELLGCHNLTTRKRFCSPKHQKLFNTWKLRAKDKGMTIDEYHRNRGSHERQKVSRPTGR